MEKPKIYLVQSGLGKTYFCQQRPGWIDLDSGYLWHANIWNPDVLIALIDDYLNNGYKILLSADPETINAIQYANKYDSILIIGNSEMKEELLQRVRERDVTEQWAKEYTSIIDYWMAFYAQANMNTIILHKGQYLSDVLEEIDKA